jgi:hypothetical protein
MFAGVGYVGGNGGVGSRSNIGGIVGYVMTLRRKDEVYLFPSWPEECVVPLISDELISIEQCDNQVICKAID